jgi:hypothetical protein
MPDDSRAKRFGGQIPREDTEAVEIAPGFSFVCPRSWSAFCRFPLCLHGGVPDAACIERATHAKEQGNVDR